MTEKQREQIDEVLDNFDFEKVYKCMVALNWIWLPDNRVPCVYDLRKCARRLLNALVDSNVKLVATGGLEAYKDCDCIGVRFVVSDWYEENK